MAYVKIYGRIVTKKELKQIKTTGLLISQERNELIPAFDATLSLDKLELSRDEMKQLEVLVGGSRTADYLILFKSYKDPIVKDIPFRNIDKIRKLIGGIIKEVKFENLTPVELVSVN